MDVAFRVDSSNEIGSGHVMRCLTLAKALQNQGTNCKFICRDHNGSLIEKIKKEGFEVHVLTKNTVCETVDEPILAHADWLGADWQTDAIETKVFLEDSHPDWLIVDHYALDYRWETMLRSYCGKIMVIDDLADRKHTCDLLLDQNLVLNYEYRYEDLVPENCLKLLGPKFALLQPEYADLHHITSPRIGPVKNILVYFGGSDQNNLTGRVIDVIISLQRNDIQINVVLGYMSPYFRDIEQKIGGYNNIELFGSLPSLAPLMLKADLSIGAGGATTWERCCMGLPAIVITLAENQMGVAAELNRQGIIEWIGDYNEVTDQSLTSSFKKWLDLKSLEKQSCLGKKLLDGRGVFFISSILSINNQSELKFDRQI